MSKKSWYLLISAVVGFGVAIWGLAIPGVQMGVGVQTGLPFLKANPISKVAATGIPSCGSRNAINQVKAVASVLVNKDIALDGVTRALLDDPSYVSSQPAKQDRRTAIGEVWTSDAIEKRFNDIQAGLEYGASDSSLVEPMEHGRFVVESWRGVCATEESAQAVIFGHEVEVTASRSLVMPEEFIQIALEKQSSVPWRISGISHRQVTGG